MRRILLLLPMSFLAVPGSPPVANVHYHLPSPEIAPIDTAKDIPTPDQLVELARTDPIGFLRATIYRYRREVQGFQATLQKQERLNGKVGPVETLDVAFREEPFSVLLKWKSASAGLTDRALYVAGANNNQVLARGKILKLIHSRDPYSADAKAAGRYAIPDFGLVKSTERTLTSWQAAQGRGNLNTEYLGIRNIPEADGAQCYVLRRTNDPPEEDGITVAEVAFAVDNWLQVANVLKGPDGQLVGAYYFRDLKLNPEFPPDQFERAALSRD